MSIPLEALRRVVTPVRVERGYREAGLMPREDAERVLEIGSLVLVVEREPSREERAAFAAIAAEMAALAGGDSLPGIDALLMKGPARNTAEASAARARAIATELRSEGMRRLAYKVALALALSDLAVSDAESVLDEWVADALEISPDEAQEIAAEVYELLQGAGD